MARPLLLPVAALVALLASCGSTAPSRFFALSALEPGSEATLGDVIVQVDGVRVAEYLDRPQLVRRTSAVELQVDEYHRWAEPLDGALTRVLDADLRALLGAVDGGQQAPVVRLVCRVTRFERDADGRAVLAVSWTLEDIAPRGPSRHGTWMQRTPLERRDDPAELAAALDGLVHAFARAMAREVVAD